MQMRHTYCFAISDGSYESANISSWRASRVITEISQRALQEATGEMRDAPEPLGTTIMPTRSQKSGSDSHPDPSMLAFIFHRRHLRLSVDMTKTIRPTARTIRVLIELREGPTLPISSGDDSRVVAGRPPLD